MSYNRGYGQGGGGTPYRSNLTQNLGQRNMVSPWECGVAPNSRGQIQNNILPLMQQSPINSNVLAQQHALAVASNLLSTLGMLPQPQQRQQELPSLLNLAGLANTSMQFGNQQQNFGRVSMNNRFNNNVGSVRRKQEQSNYRPEPYNKNRGRQSHVQQSPSQQHQQGRTRYPQVPRNQPDRKPAAAAVRANIKTPASSKGLPDLRLKLQKPSDEQGESEDSTENGKEDDDADAQDPAKSSEKKVEETEPGSDVAVDEEAKRDDEEDGSVKKKNKRDWKDEKKSDIIKIDKDKSVDLEEVSKEPADPVVAEKTDDTDSTKKVDKQVKKQQKNADKSFNCHVCRQPSQGELAFVKHLNSKTHKVAMENLSERYKKEADNMRRNMQAVVRAKEQQLQRQNKLTRNTPRDFCKMCDLRFIGHLPAHRRDEKHLKLKTFLHPRCRTCDKEFPTRLEWDNHRLSILHQLRASVKPENIEDDEMVVGKPSVLEDLVQPNPDSEIGSDPKGDDDGGEIQYDPNQCYGLEVTIAGFHCKACEVFVLRKRDHCKIKSHFHNFLLYKAKEKEAADLALKTTEAQALAQQESETSDAKILTEEADPVEMDTESAVKVDNEGNWKRPRLETAEDEEDEDAEVISITPVKKMIPVVELEETPPVHVKDGSAPYDPLDVDMESLNDNSKDVPDSDDPIMGDLDDAINEILVSAQLDEVDTVDEKEAILPVRGPRARRGRGGAVRGRKRK